MKIERQKLIEMLKGVFSHGFYEGDRLDKDQDGLRVKIYRVYGWQIRIDIIDPKHADLIEVIEDEKSS